MNYQSFPILGRHRLMVLESAIRGVKKTMLPDELKTDLKKFYQKHRQSPSFGRAVWSCTDR